MCRELRILCPIQYPLPQMENKTEKGKWGYGLLLTISIPLNLYVELLPLPGRWTLEVIGFR